MPFTDPIAQKEYNTQYYLNTKSKFYWRYIKNSYGLSQEDFEQILKAQDCKCKLCGLELTETIPSRKIHLDHCHETNKVRGILCMPCNVGLGMLGDTVEKLEKALAYVRGELS